MLDSFLLGEAQLNYVLKFKDPKNIKKALDRSAPQELFGVYESIMESISKSYEDSRALVLTIFGWIYYAKRPLRMTELREALAVEEGETSLDEDVLMTPTDIVEICGSLVIHEEETGVVSFAHEQVQAFLTSSYLSDQKSPNALLPEIEIAKTCLNYLLLDAFKDGPTPDQNSLEDRLAKHRFAGYTARYWGTHITSANAERDPAIQKLLDKLSLSLNRIDAISELSYVTTASDWNDYSWDRGKSLFHLYAESGLTMLAKDLAKGQKVFRPINYLN